MYSVNSAELCPLSIRPSSPRVLRLEELNEIPGVPFEEGVDSIRLLGLNSLLQVESSIIGVDEIPIADDEAKVFPVRRAIIEDHAKQRALVAIRSSRVFLLI